MRPGLVLTARHLVRGDDGECFDRPHVRFMEDGVPLRCQVVWPGRPDLDVALLEFAGHAPSCVPVRWGQLVTSDTGIGCEAAGFPASMEQDDGVRELEHMCGEINAGTGLLGGRIYADVTSSVPKRRGWAGMSGAALWCGPLVIGVIAWDLDAFAAGRLAAEPVPRMFADPLFRALVGEDFAVEAVELTRPRPHLVAPTPAYLLRADAETVRFRSRATELTQLASWCEGGGVRVRLVTGPGGQGKTRLARELASRLASTGQWVTEMLPEGTQFPTGIRRPLLAVLDYAETRPEQVGQLVLSAACQPGQVPIRILLLARSAGDWWGRLSKQTAELEMALADAIIDDLSPLEDTPVGRTQAFTEAVRDYAKALTAMGWPCASPDRISLPDLAGEQFGSALRLQMTALAALLAPNAIRPPNSAMANVSTASRDPGQFSDVLSNDRSSALDADSVEEVILRHEARYWERSAVQHGLRLHELTLRRAVAAATLCGAANESEALRLLGCVRGLRDQSDDVRMRAALWLRDLYPLAADPVEPAVSRPRSPEYWGILEPDLLAEHLVVDVVAEVPDLLPTLLQETSARQDHQALTVLARAAVTHPQVATSVEDLLLQLPGLAPAAARVATETAQPAPLVIALVGLVKAGGLPISFLTRISAAIPHRTQALAGFAVIIEDNLTAARSRLAEDDPKAYLPDLAKSLNNLSVRLGEAERWTEGLDAIERAVTIREKLAEDDPDAYLPDLARSLNNLSVDLAAAGRRAEGLAAIERAVAIREKLAEDDPDAYLPDLARSLNNLSVDLAAAGRRAEGLAAAERAATMYEQLAEDDPDAYLPDLARSLNNLSNRLGEAGQRAEGLDAIERAVTIREKLAEDDPDAYLPDLARSLNNLSVDLAAAGRRAEGLDAIERAVAIRERLAEANPNFYSSNLEKSVASMSVHLGRSRPAT